MEQMKNSLRIASVLLVFVATAESLAVVILLKDKDQPVVGFPVRETKDTVTIAQVLPGGKRRELSFDRSDIELIRKTVDPETLASLSSEKPRGYSNYAEELIEKQQDPEARQAAIRLYLIAAHLDREKLGYSAMLGLIRLARNQTEETKFRAMAYLVDPDRGERELKRPAAVKAASTDLDDQTKGRLLKAVRLLRQGKKYSARQYLSYPDAKVAFAHFAEIMTFNDFERACMRGDTLPSTLRKLITLELMLVPNVSSKRTASTTLAGPVSWSESIRRDGTSPVPVLSLETLTEFDPRLCHFRDGKWVADAD